MTAAPLARHVGAASFDAAIILGTGLGALADAVEAPRIVPYADLPGFPATGVSGHAGRLVVGQLEGRRVAVLQGRAHAYEHGDARVMAPVIEALAAHGTGALLLTNAAGSLDPARTPGSLMAISDHVALFGPNPLVGMAGDSRFVPMNDAYDPRLRALLSEAAHTTGVAFSEGVYAWVTGPSFETPAEIRLLARLGADAVGMSTVPEVILARHAGLRVAAISMITNLGAGLAPHAPSHAETKAMAHAGAAAMETLLRALLARLPQGMS